MRTINSIAVIGATGMLGTPVTGQLYNAGFKIRVMARDTEKAQKKLPAGVEIIKGDVKDVNSLQKAFQGMDAIYVSLSTYPNEKNTTFQTENQGVQNIIKAAEKTGIRRIGYLSSLVQEYDGFDWWVFDIKRKAIGLLKSSSIPVTIFYPSNFYENLSELQLRGSKVMLVGDQITKSWWIGAHDYGKQVARSFRIQDDEDKEYPIQGPEPYNFEEAADIFIEHYQPKQLKKMKAPLWIFKHLGWFSGEFDFQYHILYAINHYDEQFQSEKTWQELGKPQTTLPVFSESLSH